MPGGHYQSKTKAPMAHDLKALVNYLPGPQQKELERQLDQYDKAVDDAIFQLRYEANRFEEFLQEVFYGYPRPEKYRDY